MSIKKSPEPKAATVESRPVYSLVTGGAGSLGSHLCGLLRDHGHVVHWIDNFSAGRRENVDHLRGTGQGEDGARLGAQSKSSGRADSDDRRFRERALKRGTFVLGACRLEAEFSPSERVP
ncbi:NAD-dependent epimerase/dehydratase family protein [Mesorhizobium qingshengii]|uniref:NAD-dependent epimerase/dehydratase family protein n=1 Tax=Mesorhizobium qingshengii TaxID=1165689 RepID=UPI00115FDB80